VSFLREIHDDLLTIAHAASNDCRAFLASFGTVPSNWNVCFGGCERGTSTAATTSRHVDRPRSSVSCQAGRLGLIGSPGGKKLRQVLHNV